MFYISFTEPNSTIEESTVMVAVDYCSRDEKMLKQSMTAILSKLLLLPFF